MTEIERPSLVDYEQAMRDAEDALLADTGIPRGIWDRWTQVADETHQLVELRHAALAEAVRNRMPRFVRLREEQDPSWWSS